MPTLKRFLDEAGLIQLLLEIEALDETNVKDLYWSTDNADTYPTIVFKVGDDNGLAHSIKKITFKGDTTSPAPTGATARKIKLTVGGTDKEITYYDTNTTAASGITYSNSTDSGVPALATDVQTALNRIIYKLSNSTGTDENVIQTALARGSEPTYHNVLLNGTNVPDGTAGHTDYTSDLLYDPYNRAFKIHSNHPTTPNTSVTTTFKNGVITFPGGTSENPKTIDGDTYTGRAAGTETYILGELASKSVSTPGASLIGYGDGENTVLDVIDGLDTTVNGISTEITNLKNGTNLVQGSNITLTKDTTNHTVTIAASDLKVAYTSAQTNTAVPIVLSNGATPTSPGGVKYASSALYNPSTGTATFKSVTGNGSTVSGTKKVEISGDSITFTPASGTAISFSGAASTSAYGVVKLATVSASSGGTADATNDPLVPTLGDVKNLIKNVNQAQFVLTNYTSESLLPTVTASNKDDYLGKIYLIEDLEYADTNSNIYKEYIVVEYTNQNDVTDYRWELLGTTDAGVDVVTIPPTGDNSVASMFATYVTNA